MDCENVFYLTQFPKIVSYPRLIDVQVPNEMLSLPSPRRCFAGRPGLRGARPSEWQAVAQALTLASPATVAPTHLTPTAVRETVAQRG